ncbi:MAG: Mut7-C RNAse domain-containing protein [Candidatus Jordarchaeaceae archaeon]
MGTDESGLGSAGMVGFACDAMLGRIARWLRLLGYDTFYYSRVRDDELLEVCLRRNLVLLTRDVEFFKKAVSHGIRAKLLQENSFENQFADVVDSFGLDLRITPDGSRCPACNGLIRRVDKGEIKNRVPVNTMNSYDSFFMCSNCGKVYWMGRMWRSMIRICEAVREKLKKKSFLDS